MAAMSNYPSTLPASHQQSAPPPSKASLKAWWRQFTLVQRIKPVHANSQNHASLVKEWGQKRTSASGQVFGVPLRESLRYASVHISTAQPNGEMYVWGYVPVVVAKCGLYLKEYATEVEGTFRINGSSKRMRELQVLFETPPKYGKNVDWTKETYTTHDVASVFRRFLTQMPEPVIPFDKYDSFRQVLARQPPLREDEAIHAYKRLILELPRANQYLLLYVLDLLSVFMRKADKNLMTSTNLATIFRPGILSHPSHEMSPVEHRLSQTVLEFLIAQQDWFMLDVPPPPRRDSIMNSAPTDMTNSPSPNEKPLDMRPGGEEAHWKLVETEPGKEISRRRTTIERGSIRNPSVKVLVRDYQQPLSSVFTATENGEVSEDVILGEGTARVKRSATIPSRSSEGGNEDLAPLPKRRFPGVANVLEATNGFMGRSKSPQLRSSPPPDYHTKTPSPEKKRMR